MKPQTAAQRFERLVRAASALERARTRWWNRILTIVRKYPAAHRLYPFDEEPYQRVLQIDRQSELYRHRAWPVGHYKCDTFCTTVAKEGDPKGEVTPDAQELWRLDRMGAKFAGRAKVIREYRDALLAEVKLT
jgi:hypothetical protein